MTRRHWLPFALMLLAAPGVPWLVTTTADASSRQARTIPDVSVLFPQAVKRVRQTGHGTFARTTVLEADGITHGGQCGNAGCTDGQPVATAGGIVAWRFVFQNPTPHSRYASVTLSYGPLPKRFGRVTGHVESFLEDVRIARAPRMTVAKAVSLLRHAGYRRTFSSVTLRRPLGPRRINPLYIFSLTDGRYVAVDTRTGMVRPLT